MRTETGSWTVKFKDETAPTEERRFVTEQEAKKAAQNFGTTMRKRAYVYDLERHLVGWQHDGKWHWD
jgi:hypothetical protein